jgi:hypothetical protein
MAHPVTPNHMKSPALMAATVNTAAGHTVLDNRFSLLDPTLAEKQLNAFSGVNAFRKTGPLDRGINDPHWTPDGLALACGLIVS